MAVALSSLPFEWHVWVAARLLPVIAKRGSLDRLLAFATPDAPVPAYAGLSAERILDEVGKATERPWRMRGRRCLREGLLAYRFLAMAGYRPVLSFAISPRDVASQHPHAHCWLSLDGETVLNPPTEPMVHLFDYDGSTHPATDGDAALGAHA